MTKRRRRVRKAPTPRKRRAVNKLALYTIIVYLIICIGFVGLFTGLFMMNKMLKGKPNLEVNDFIAAESSHIYDKNGNLIADVGTQIRTNVTYDDIPEALVDAFVSIEDSRYFGHNGFDISRFTKAMLENVKARRFAQGGSTLTMQLVKQTYFTNDEAGIGASKSIDRKVQEIALATELEKEVDKKRIFQLYINKLNFGGSGNIRGVQKASQYYFGKEVSELNLDECAMLAGIVNAPYSYNPFLHLDYATNRRNTVLNMMVRHGYITKKEYELARSIKVEDLLVDYTKVAKSNGKNLYAYQSYIDTVINEVEEITGMDPTTIAMEIYTYMDPEVQTVMDNIQSGQAETVPFPDDLMEVAMLSLNNQTGEIVAIGGGRNYGAGGSMLLNHATQQFKQPGSSVKPFLDYALAFEYLGWATSHVVTDRPIVYKGTDKVIRNADGTYAGQVTLKYAVGKSLNTPAIQTLQEVIDTAGWTTVVEYLKSLGFSKVSEDNFDIGFAIGGSNFTVNAVELAGAHAVVMNGGQYIEPHTVARIEFKNGTPTYTANYIGKQVLSPQAAYLTSELMYDAVNGPYYNYMQILKREYPVYGKTGTTDWGSEGLQYNIPQGAAKDKWMISETSQYTTAVWVGYEKGVKDKDTYFTSAKSQLNLPGNISSLILSALNDNLYPQGVPQPEGISSITHIIGTYPYASPIEGMDGQYITTGKIKSDKYNLVSPESAKIETLQHFTANIDGGNVVLNWTPYPDEDRLKVADETMDLSLSSGNAYVEAWGHRIFDYTWIFGPIRYKAKLYQNGEFLTEIVSDTDTFTGGVTMEPGKTIKACGFYAYENLDIASNELCEDFKSADNAISLNVPSRNANRVDIENWAGSAGIIAEFTTVENNEKAGTNEIQFGGKVVNDTAINTTASQISTIKVQVTIYTKGAEPEPAPENGEQKPE